MTVFEAVLSSTHHIAIIKAYESAVNAYAADQSETKLNTMMRARSNG